MYTPLEHQGNNRDRREGRPDRILGGEFQAVTAGRQRLDRSAGHVWQVIRRPRQCGGHRQGPGAQFNTVLKRNLKSIMNS